MFETCELFQVTYMYFCSVYRDASKTRCATIPYQAMTGLQDAIKIPPVEGHADDDPSSVVPNHPCLRGTMQQPPPGEDDPW